MLKTALQKLALYNDLVKSKRTTPEAEKEKAMERFNAKPKFPEKALDFNFWKEGSLFQKLAFNAAVDARLTPEKIDQPVGQQKPDPAISKPEKKLSEKLNKSVGEFPDLSAGSQSGAYAGSILNMSSDILGSQNINSASNNNLPGGRQETMQMIQPTPQLGGVQQKQKALV